MARAGGGSKLEIVNHADAKVIRAAVDRAIIQIGAQRSCGKCPIKAKAQARLDKAIYTRQIRPLFAVFNGKAGIGQHPIGKALSRLGAQPELGLQVMQRVGCA